MGYRVAAFAELQHLPTQPVVLLRLAQPLDFHLVEGGGGHEITRVHALLQQPGDAQSQKNVRAKSVHALSSQLLSHRMYSLLSVRKSTPPQIRQLDMLISDI